MSIKLSKVNVHYLGLLTQNKQKIMPVDDIHLSIITVVGQQVITLKESVQDGFMINLSTSEVVHVFGAVESHMGKTVPVGYFVEVVRMDESEVREISVHLK